MKDQIYGEVKDVKKRMIAVLFLLCLLTISGISPILNEVVDTFETLLNFYEDAISVVNDGDTGGGGGVPNGGGGG